MKTLFPLTGLALAAALPATAQTELTVYHAWPHHAEWQQEIADRFIAANPDVSIDFQAPAPDYDEGLVSVIRQNLAGDPPDVFMAGSHLLGDLVARDMVQPLDDMIGDTDLNAEGYTDAVLAFTQVNGTQYGLPWTSSTPVMFYNAELVEQAGGDPDDLPDTWEETIALAADIDALGDDIMGMYYTPGDDDWMTQNLLASAGLAPIAEDGTIAFDTDRGREAIALFERLHDEGGQTAISNNDARQQMYAGKLGLYFNSTAAVRSFEREIGDRFAWGTAQMPKLVDEGGVASGGMAAVILTDDPEKRAAAWDYLLFGTGPEAQALVVENTGYMPVNTGALEVLGDFYQDHPQFETSAQQTDRAYPWFGWPGQNGARISQIVLDRMAAIANDQQSAEEAAAGMTEEIAAQLPQ
ncbi:ABC transporter substrate-binding protein [Jannaschia rubra]|uniref:sn-glycerol-3-phosphate-binding periplasmic protein UgpB n=1 Tax=Jannaschia rubra TaxID=282197 RepID=A0A0M6XWF6_9RHOB|nr:ABC transporter substrate-binding protein [Jannaschia rubra]CTQ34611.1 sn-glycerol-3-phosphate-binding periplasmic protein UgpB precursor [Jannaschia rubra]SFG71962.1 carbohydrate ABC transporter substrate-binding protein, CUT1 family [Jannaschia rubra]